MGLLRGRFLNKGRLVMNDRSSLSYQYLGEGIYNLGTMVMNDRSSVVGNWVGGDYIDYIAGVGGGVHNRGTLIMRHHSSIHSNHADAAFFNDGVEEPAGRGGGVYNSGRVVMQGSAAIFDNEAEPSRTPAKGGGIYNAKGGTLVMRDQASIHGNKASDADYPDLAGLGAGIYNAADGILDGVTCGPGGNVYGNTPDDCYFAE